MCPVPPGGDECFFYQITHLRRCKQQSSRFTKAARWDNHSVTLLSTKKSWETSLFWPLHELRWRGQRLEETVTVKYNTQTNNTYLASILSWKDKSLLRHESLSLQRTICGRADMTTDVGKDVNLSVKSCMFSFSTFHGWLRECFCMMWTRQKHLSHLSTNLQTRPTAVLLLCLAVCEATASCDVLLLHHEV